MRLFSAATLVALFSTLFAAGLGVERQVPALADTWPVNGPPVLWRKAVGAGFSGPVVTGGPAPRVILFHRIYDARSSSRWTRARALRHGRPPIRHSYRDDFGFDEGPRAVPVVADGVVYTFGAEGQLHALGSTTGMRLWSEDTVRRFGVAKAFFGAAGSPLVEDGRLIANVGGKAAGIVAFDAKTGKVLWTATDDGASSSSRRRRDDRWTAAGVVPDARGASLGLDPATGRVSFQRPWRARQAASVNVATPLVVGDRIFMSAEYGPGAGVLRVNGETLTDVWTSDETLSNHYATSVYATASWYGFHGRQEFGPPLRAVEPDTGKFAGVRIYSAPAASRWPASGCSSCARAAS